MKTLFNLIGVTISIFYCGSTFGQKLREPTLKISDCIKGLNDNDYLRATLIENGFIFVVKNGIDNTAIGIPNGVFELWAIMYQSDDQNYGEPFRIVEVSISSNPDFPKIRIGISVKKDFFANYGNKLIAETVKSFSHKKVSHTRDDTPIYFVEYTRDSDKILISYSFQNNDYCFEIFGDQ